MILLLLIGLLVVWVLGPIIVHSFTGNVNTIIGIIVAALILLVWYYISVRYFWTMIDKMKKQPGYISTKEHQEEVEAEKEAEDLCNRKRRVKASKNSIINCFG